MSIEAGVSPDQGALIVFTGLKESQVEGRKVITEVVQRVVQTQVPTDRVAELKLLLTAPCVGKVTDCSVGHSCQPASGTCGPNQIDSSSLPTYVPGNESIDGDGSTGTDGGAEGAEGADAVAATACGFTMPNPANAGLPNPASYTLNGPEGTVADDVTGLTWEERVGPTLYTQGQAVRQCASKGGDWRLPTRVELVSLVDFTLSNGLPTIYTIFINTPRERFWTSSHSAGDPNIGWYVGFDDGSAHQVTTSDAYRIRCVRGAASHCSPTRYQVQADQTVRDRTTGLTWQRMAGQKQPWSNAMKYCSSLGTGWRLPSLTELQTIVDETVQSPAIDGDAFPGTPSDFFWTSSPSAAMASDAWYVAFIHGHADIDTVTSSFLVRCVR
jgi:hypothetical protein